MSGIDPKVYKSILNVKAAYPFDIAGFLMRFYAYMMSIGTVSMLSLSGYSFLKSGIVASLIAFSIFLFSPRISKLVDEKGQSRIVPIAVAIVLCGLALMLSTVQFHGPDILLYIAAPLMGCIPNAQALVRARWTFLLRTGRLGDDAPNIRTVFSYEGVIDDIAFMLSPPFAIAAGAAIAPIAGLLIGSISFVIGATILSLSKSTEPTVGWVATDGSASDQTAKTDTPEKTRSIIATSSVVKILFAMMFLTGGFYGVFDSTSIAFSEQLDDPNIASRGLMASGLLSAGVGFVFGMIKLKAPFYKQLMTSSILIGVIYANMIFVTSEMSFYIFSCVAALFYAPFLIVANSACERSVPGSRLTEAITWINSGMTCGVAIGPTLAGILIDEFGDAVSFACGGAIAIMIPIIAIASHRLLKRGIKG